MIADPPRFVADVAAQVVAWHNRHPLARRITRKDVQGVGIVALPFARDGQRRWDAPQAKRSLLALMFPPRRRRRQWPVFSEDLVPEIGAQRLAKFALRHGQEQRPGPADLPERTATVDRDLLDEGGNGAEFPPERLDRYLLTAAIDIGPNRPRLMLGTGKRPAVLGQRLWSLPRLAALGGGLLLAMVIGAAGLWLKAMPQRGAGAAPKAAASTAAHKPPSANAGSNAPASSPVSAASAAPHTTATPRPSAASAPAVQASAAAVPASGPASATPPAHAAPQITHAQHPPQSPAAPASTAAITAPAATSPASSGPPPTIVERASEPLVPRLRPDLAASARAEGLPRAPAVPGRGTSPASPGPAQPPGAAEPRAVPPAPPAALHFYALVTRPVRTKAEGEAMLRRLRAETDRIAHPTATQTALQETRDGWRATWWPFTNPRQAENARQALARRIELEVIDF